MIDRRRALRAVVLLCWSGFFAWLWLSGEMTRYLGPRTYWVVIFGALSLGAAGLAHVVTLRSEDGPGRIASSDAVAALVLLIPLVAVLTVPDARLGAQAASRKASAGGLAAASLLPLPEPDGEISFIDLHYAMESAEYAASAGVTEGAEVELTGFVTYSPSGRLQLTRFYVSCCAADAIPYSAALGGAAGRWDEDVWLDVEGTVSGSGDGLHVEVTSVREVEPPDDPYLY